MTNPKRSLATHNDERSSGQRFAFGANWQRFLAVLNEARIRAAEDSIREMLAIQTLGGKTFLDVGSGSGLFSLAARRLGAKVHSFDYDPDSVACTAEVKRRYFPSDPNWRVEEGSVLDQAYLKSLGLFDFVYSWGVLHHTGQMWNALGNVAPLVHERGTLFISIYNDQGGASLRWKLLKRLYNKHKVLRGPLAMYTLLRQWSLTMVRDMWHGNPRATWKSYGRQRGMSPWHDVVDWIGGFPFEVAKPEEVFDFFTARGFRLTRLKTCGGGLGCNEYVFARGAAS